MNHFISKMCKIIQFLYIINKEWSEIVRVIGHSSWIEYFWDFCFCLKQIESTLIELIISSTNQKLAFLVQNSPKLHCFVLLDHLVCLAKPLSGSTQVGMGVKNPFSLTFKHNHHQCQVWFLSHVRTSIFFLEGFRHGIEKKCLDLHYCNHWVNQWVKLYSN